jgi:uncharacterized protein
MHYYDDVYGRCQVQEGLLTDLMRSSAVRRLRKVSQAGASSFVRPGRTNTRHEHSVGVMTLTGILGGTEQERAAGLLQDLSHTAFSHTIDVLFENRKEQFHEDIFDSVIENSDVPQILKKHGTTWRELFSKENLGRVDASAPLLCADRIDYTLRDLIRTGYLTASAARAFVEQLDFLDGIIVSTEVEAAEKFVVWYSHLVGDVFMNPVELYTHHVFAQLLKKALRVGVITEADLMSTDDVVLGKLLADDAHGLDAGLSEIRRVRSVTVGDQAHGVRVYSKGRKIDPPVVVNGQIRRLSEVRPETTKAWSKIDFISSEGLLVSVPSAVHEKAGMP